MQFKKNTPNKKKNKTQNKQDILDKGLYFTETEVAYKYSERFSLTEVG